MTICMDSGVLNDDVFEFYVVLSSVFGKIGTCIGDNRKIGGILIGFGTVLPEFIM